MLTHSSSEEKYSEILEYNADEDTDPGPDPNFYYNLQELYKRATTSDAANGVPPNFLTLFHSFGYECLKRANLHVLDEQNVLFSAGNYVQILNIETKKITYLPTMGGGGIGAIAVSLLVLFPLKIMSRFYPEVEFGLNWFYIPRSTLNKESMITNI